MDTVNLEKQDLRKLEIARNFTEAFRNYLHAPPAIREAMCLRAQYPALCDPIRDGDLFVGRVMYHPYVGFLNDALVNPGIRSLDYDDKPDLELSDKEKFIRSIIMRDFGGFVYDWKRFWNLAEEFSSDSYERKEIEDIIHFWEENSILVKYFKSLDDDIRRGMSRVSTTDAQYAAHFFRVCCYSLDFDKLLQLGIPGLMSFIEKRKAKVQKNGEDVSLFEGMLEAMDILVSVCRYYEAEVLEMAEREPDKNRKCELLTMAETLRAIVHERPRSFRDAIQLFWLYCVCSDSINYGRMDVYFGDFYVNDVEKGVITENDAESLLRSLWTLISDQYKDGYIPAINNCRVIVGGKGRRNEKNADKFALLAMKVTLTMKEQEPNLTLRFYRGQNPVLFEKALKLIGEGCIHPSLYNDDEHIPMVAKAYNVSVEEAEHYIPEGCGEIQLDHRSISSPNNIINYAAALDLVLHNGYNTYAREQRGLTLGTPDDFDTFEKLYDALKKQIDYTNDLFARRHAIEHRVRATHETFLFSSILTDDCIERGKSLFDGGTRYLGGQIETFGLTNTADSLAAIKKLVYEERRIALRKLVEILDVNFEGHEKERRILQECPKFGNDISYVDDIYMDLCEFGNRSAWAKAQKYGLHFFLNCNLNPGGVRYSEGTKATADGRRYRDPLAVGNAPTAGRDTQGLTALLSSMKKQFKLHSGYVQNLKVSKELFRSENFTKFKALLETYFETGGIQLMITTLNKDDLQKALKEPEKYQNLLVRVGGWTARYVELDKSIQMEILNRTFYE